jgi:hypothetical protein
MRSTLRGTAHSAAEEFAGRCRSSTRFPCFSITTLGSSLTGTSPHRSPGFSDCAITSSSAGRSLCMSASIWRSARLARRRARLGERSRLLPERGLRRQRHPAKAREPAAAAHEAFRDQLGGAQRGRLAIRAPLGRFQSGAFLRSPEGDRRLPAATARCRGPARCEPVAARRGIQGTGLLWEQARHGGRHGGRPVPLRPVLWQAG